MGKVSKRKKTQNKGWMIFRIKGVIATAKELMEYTKTEEALTLYVAAKLLYKRMM